MGPEGEGDWGLGAGGGGEGGLQSWGSLASLFRPQTCSTLKIGEERGNKKEGGGSGGAGGAGGGKFLHNLLNPAKKSVSLCFLLRNFHLALICCNSKINYTKYSYFTLPLLFNCSFSDIDWF